MGFNFHGRWQDLVIVGRSLGRLSSLRPYFLVSSSNHGHTQVAG